MNDGDEKVDQVHRKAAAFARQPSVWAPAAHGLRTRRIDSRGVLAVLRALFGVLAVSLLPPALMVLVFGNPVELVPSGDTITDFLGDQRSQNAPELAVAAVGIGLWLLWAILMVLLLGSLLTVFAGWRFPRWRLPAPLHRLLVGLAGSAAVAFITTPHGGAATGQTPAIGASAPEAEQPGGSTLRQGGTVTVLVGDTRYEYEVKHGDTLSKVSRQWLGDADRWPEICRLNRHQHQADGARLTDCDLIYPGWKIRLPHDARPPGHATPRKPSPRPKTPPAKTPPPTVNPAPPEKTAPAASSPVTPPASVAPSSAPTSEAPVLASPTADSSSAPPAVDDSRDGSSADKQGVSPSAASWLPWSLAAAISAASALVWRQRRRRDIGEPDNDPPTDLPPAVVEVRRAVHRNPEQSRPITDDTEPPGLPDLVPLPTGGVGLAGDGAPGAARAALVAALASGGPHHPNTRAEIIIDTATLDTLLGPNAITIDAWPRLHVTKNLDEALTIVEARLLHRSRLLDEHALTDLDELRRAAPDEEALPPLLLVTETPPAGARTRAKAVLTLGEELHVSALLLGDWPQHATIEVTSDGTTTLLTGQPTTPVPGRLPVLDTPTAIDILATLREAHTGEPPTITSPATVIPLHASRTEEQSADTRPPTLATPAETTRARLRVLGPPRIDNITKEGRPLRAKALELAVYLAVHPDGAATREIGEYLEPDARVNQADQRVHTNASNLRHVLGRAGTTEPKNAYVIKTAGRYRLDPATVDVDVWTLRDLMRKATIATEPRRRELLAAACELCSAPLAEGQDYEWIQPHRETVRRWGTEAHLMLADDLLDSDPQAASDLLDKAIGMDRYNEALYVKAMHARHALADADGIRTLLRALTKALADLDAEPREDTLELANTLRTSLDSK